MVDGDRCNQETCSDPFFSFTVKPKPPSARKAAPSAPVQALRLLGKWMRIAQGHVPFGMGCSCGGGFGSLRVQDFDENILDYLRGKHATLVGEAGSVENLLHSFVRKNENSEAKILLLLADLETSIDSFDQQHAR